MEKLSFATKSQNKSLLSPEYEINIVSVKILIVKEIAKSLLVY